jgi:predicted transcriptional regulator
MNPAQRNYQVYDKELLAVMHSLTEWWKYLLGAKEPINIVTDHRNLEYYRQPQNLSRRQANWISQLMECDVV